MSGAVVFVRARSRRDLVILGWFAVMLVVNLRQTAWWHPTALFAWVAAPVRDGKDANHAGDTLVLAGRLSILLFITGFVFHQNAWYYWLLKLP